MKKTYHVYILTNISKMLYVGVTGDLHRRIFEHKQKLVPGYCNQYNLHRLVYWEGFGDIRDAIAREKEIKGWLRSKKVALIQSMNPNWKDLAADWFGEATTPNKTSQRKRAARRECHPEGPPFGPEGPQRIEPAKAVPRTTADGWKSPAMPKDCHPVPIRRG